MKTIKIFGLLLLTSPLFMACSKDDDEDVANVSGTKWEATYYSESYTVAGIGQSNVYDTKAELEAADMYDVVEVKADGTYYIDGVKNGTWKQSGSKVTFTDEDEEETTFTVSGSTMSMKSSETMEGIAVTINIKYSKM